MRVIKAIWKEIYGYFEFWTRPIFDAEEIRQDLHRQWRREELENELYRRFVNRR